MTQADIYAFLKARPDECFSAAELSHFLHNGRASHNSFHNSLNQLCRSRLISRDLLLCPTEGKSWRRVFVYSHKNLHEKSVETRLV